MTKKLTREVRNDIVQNVVSDSVYCAIEYAIERILEDHPEVDLGENYFVRWEIKVKRKLGTYE